ncbi:MAG: serine/threonine-protein kinase [Pirellulaceae bacterium]
MAKSRIGPFSLDAPLSKPKSSGQVFRGLHLEQKKLAAIRIFPIPMGLTPETRAAFASQLEQLKQLRHRGIVRCYGGGFDTRNAFLAYEMVEGESLTSILARRERLPWETALDYSQQMAEALQYAHQMGWVHGRLRPGKIVISETGIAKIGDWRREAISSMMQAPLTPEQIQFTAPEYFDNVPPDEKQDLYGLGAVMYTMLTGRPPCVGTDAASLIRQVQSGEIQSVASQVLDCPVWLNVIVGQLLARDPVQRPFSAIAVQLAFKEAQRRQSEGVGVLQHATAGFSPLQMNVDREEAEKVLGIKKKKARKSRDTSVFESTWFLVSALLLAIGAAVWFMLPLSEQGLREHAEKLLASEDWADWNHARNEYLTGILQRFPDGKHSEWATEKIEWVDAREAERKLDREERLGKTDNWTQAQVQYAEARKFERFGDLATALDRFRAIVNLFGTRDEDRAVVLLASEAISRIRAQGMGENALQEFIQAKLDEAEAAYDKARITDAKLKLESIVELYGTNQEVAPLVEKAKTRLAEINNPS